MKKRKWLFLGCILWACVIFSFSLQPADMSNDTSMGFISKVLGFIMPGLMEYMENMPQEQLDMLHHIVRKGAHFTEYFVLGILSGASAVVWNEWIGKKKYVIAMLYCVVVASIDETIQLFVDGRAGRIQDVLLDSVGAAAGIGFLFFMIAVSKYISKQKLAP